MSTDLKPYPITRPPLPDGRPETWVYVADCAMPEDARRAVELEVKEHRFRGQALAYLEENIKFHYLFGGLEVTTTQTARGLTVIRAEEPETSQMTAWYLALPLEKRAEYHFEYLESPYEERETRI